MSSNVVKRWLAVSLFVFSIIGVGTVSAQHLTSHQGKKELKSARQLFADISNTADYDEDRPQANDDEFMDDAPKIEEV